MKKGFFWIFLMSKRQLKRPMTVTVLICMLLAVVGMSFIPTSINASLSIGFCMDESHIAIKQALNEHEGVLHFIEYEDSTLLEDHVISGTIQGGYIFNEDLSNITTYRASKSQVSTLSDVVILAIVMEYSADDMLIDDILNQDFFEGMTEEDIASIRKTYELYATNGSTFAFDYSTLYEDYAGSSSTLNIAPYIATPVRGIISIFIFVAALAAGTGAYIDAHNHIYANIPLKRHPLLRLLNISIPSILSGIVGLFGIFIVGISNHYAYEVFAITVYTFLCIGFSFALTYTVRRNFFHSLIPVFILGSIICCPIFFNLGNILPAMKFLQHLFLPTYYFTIFF